MKKLRSIVTIIFLSMVLMGMTSCAVRMHEDNGRHRGWFHRNDDRPNKRDAVLIINTDDDHNHR